ncbi:UNVERIFIED_ORG: hypothetical protein EDC93_101210 [Bacillus cereus]
MALEVKLSGCKHLCTKEFKREQQADFYKKGQLVVLVFFPLTV